MTDWNKLFKEINGRNRKAADRWYDKMYALYKAGKGGTKAYEKAKARFYYFSARCANG